MAAAQRKLNRRTCDGLIIHFEIRVFSLACPQIALSGWYAWERPPILPKSGNYFWVCKGGSKRKQNFQNYDRRCKSIARLVPSKPPPSLTFVVGRSENFTRSAADATLLRGKKLWRQTSNSNIEIPPRCMIFHL